MQTQPLTDQIANISPLYVVMIVLGLTLLRVALARTHQSWARAVSETCDTINFVLILAFLLVRPFVAQAFYIPSASMRQTLLEGDRLIVDKFSYRLHQPNRYDVVVFNAPREATDEHVEGIDFIKRLIGLPGDTIEVRAASLRFGDEPFDAFQQGLNAHEFLRTHLNLDSETSIKFYPDYIAIGGKRRLSKAEIATVLGRAGTAITIVPGQTLINGKPIPDAYTREDPDYNYGPVRIAPGELFMLGDNRNQSRDSHVWGPLKRERVVGRAFVVFWPPARMGKIQ